MATFASTSYTFSSDSLLFQSLPKHPILTEVPSDLCDHHGPTSEPNYWQKLLLILLSDSLPFQSFPKRRIPYTEEIASNPCNHNGPTSEPNYWQKLLLILVTIKHSLRIQSVYCLPKCTSKDGPFYSIFPWFHSIFPGFTWFSMFFLYFPLSIFPWFYSIFAWFCATFPWFYSTFRWFYPSIPVSPHAPLRTDQGGIDTPPSRLPLHLIPWFCNLLARSTPDPPL